MAMRVTLAGQVRVEVDGAAVDLAALGRAGRLFWAYLVCERHRPVPKDELAEVLWGEDELPRSWEQMLRGNATKVRASLVGAGIGPTVVASAFGAYQVRLPDDVVVDVEHAEQDLARAVGALAAGDPDSAAHAAAAAAAVGARGFLPGWSGLWVERRQAELRELRLRALEALAQASCARCAWADAVGAAEEAIGVEPFRESAFQTLIAAHRGAGSPAEALRAYERCRRALAEELGVSPSAVTETAYLAVLLDEPVSPAVTVPQLPLPVALAARPSGLLVGRKAETDRLRSVLERVAGDGRQAVLVGGEPGVGKTALVTDFARQAHDLGARVLYGRCDEEIGIAYQPFAEAFGYFLSRCPLAELRAHVGAHGGELARIAPQLTYRLPDTPPPRVTGSDGDRYRFFDAAAALLEQASRDQLLVLVLDDLHWAGPQTLALLRHILRPRPSSFLVVGTYRHTEVGPDDPLAATLADLRREPGVERMFLAGLDEHGVSAIVEANPTHRLGASDESLARALHARTAGNPFFVGEFLRHLDESGAVLGKEGRWSYYEDEDGLGLPQGVRDVVSRRLGRLSAGANRALTLASVVGLTFEIELLEQIDRAAMPDDVLDALDEAVAAHVLAELEPGRFQFAHALVRDTVYSALTATRRARLHHSVGDALASLPGDVGPRLPALARHYAEAVADGTAIQAADYALAAARQAFAQAAWDDALAFVTLGVDVLSSSEPEHLKRRFDLLLLEIETQFVLVRIPLAIEAILQAAETAMALGSPRRLARAVTLYLLSEGRTDPRAVDLAEEALRGLTESDRALRAGVLAGLAVSQPHQVAGRSDEETEVALALARESGELDALHAALVGRRAFLCDTPRAQEWLTVEEELAALGPPSGPVAGSRWIHGVGRGRAIARLALGDRTGFDADARAVGRWFAELRNVGLGTQCAIWRANASLLDGRFGDAEACAADVASLAPGRSEVCSILRSRAALDLGRAGEARAILLQELVRWPGHNILSAIAAFAHTELGEAEEAVRIVDRLAAEDFESLRFARTATAYAYVAEVVAALSDSSRAERIYELYAPYAGLVAVSGLGVHSPGAADRFLGQLAATFGRSDDAQRHFESALLVEEGLRAPPLLARTRYWYGRMLVERSRPGDARRATALLGAAAATAEQLGMARLVEQVAALR
jgi:DNA-binding SARP family transcriptional activator